ncbi:hypothetical protein Tco_1280052 [Tanacetum coccineum]
MEVGASPSCEGGQSKIVLFLYKDNRHSQRLGATLFLSYSSFFMISCRGEQTKKRAISAKGEGPATAETTDPNFVPSHLLRVRKSLPPLPGQDRWEGALSRP